MIDDVTDAAVVQLLVLAEGLGFPQDRVVFKVEAKMRQPAQLVWYITPDSSYDDQFVPTEVKGIRFAVKKDGAIYLRDAVLNYDPRLLNKNNVYAPTAINEGRPTWPKGFVFENQTLEYLWT